jgi:hypothetical protein
MRFVVVALMLLIAGATHAAAQQYQLFPASVAARNLQVQHQAVLVTTATGDIYTCIGLNAFISFPVLFRARRRTRLSSGADDKRREANKRCGE